VVFVCLFVFLLLFFVVFFLVFFLHVKKNPLMFRFSYFERFLIGVLRLQWQAGQRTAMAVFQVGIYADKQLIGQGQFRHFVM
jgi:hypothetical protein